MLYENGVITIQAFRGKLSHFNQTEVIGGILYALMGVMIVWLTATATLIISMGFILQKNIPSTKLLHYLSKSGLYF